MLLVDEGNVRKKVRGGKHRCHLRHGGVALETLRSQTFVIPRVFVRGVTRPAARLGGGNGKGCVPDKLPCHTHPVGRRPFAPDRSPTKEHPTL